MGDRGYCRGLNFNFCLGNLLDVCHLSYRLSPDSLGTWTSILLLDDMIQLLKLETFWYIIAEQDREKTGKDLGGLEDELFRAVDERVACTRLTRVGRHLPEEHRLQITSTWVTGEGKEADE